MAPTFRVLVQGLLPGHVRAESVARLAALFKRDASQMEAMLDSGPMVVKKNVAREVALQYVDALARCGCAAGIEAEQATPAVDRNAILPQLQRADARGDAAEQALRISLPGDLALGFYADGPSGRSTINHGMLAALGLTVEELQDIAAHNLYAKVRPQLQFERVAMQGPTGETGPGFFHYLTAGEGLSATCMLLSPIWDHIGHLVQGRFRIAIPNADTCLFCGSDEELTVAMMTDIADDIWRESGDKALSRQIFTLDGAGLLAVVPDAGLAHKKSSVIDPRSRASDPGLLQLSQARLRQLQRELFEPSQELNAADRQAWLQLFEEQLARGDSRAAIVLDPERAVVAAYTDELDCVVLLQFDPQLARLHGWQEGSRLLTVNLYVPRQHGLAGDVKPGPADTGTYGNFRPMIADLLTDDQRRLADRKAQIDEAEWQRTLLQGRHAWHDERRTPRDGRPLHCGTPVEQPIPAPRQQPTGNGARGGLFARLARLARRLMSRG